MNQIPRPQEIYKHFKGNLYQIVTIAQHTETDESMVVYQAMYGDYKVYARPLAMFMSKVDREKYPDVAQEYRFELQGQANVSGAENITEEPELDLDPLLLQFLDADTYAERLNILAGLHHRITDEMITTMAIACDIEVDEGNTQERYESLKNCLVTLEKYECNRLR